MSNQVPRTVGVWSRVRSRNVARILNELHKASEWHSWSLRISLRTRKLDIIIESACAVWMVRVLSPPLQNTTMKDLTQMSNDFGGMKVQLTYFEYPQLTYPNGHLPRDKRAQACWYFYTLAQKVKENVGDSTEDQIILEGELWMDHNYEQIARSVATLYQLESPAEFMKFWSYVARVAEEYHLPPPADEYMRPMKGRLIL